MELFRFLACYVDESGTQEPAYIENLYSKEMTPYYTSMECKELICSESFEVSDLVLRFFLLRFLNF